MEYQTQKARFSRCRKFRYTLERSWKTGNGTVLFIGLNPSTADHQRDDPTIRRCVRFARDWGFNKLIVANLFAYRATYTEDLLNAQEPVGSRNNIWIQRSYRSAQLTIACWGNHGSHIDRSTHVRQQLPRLHYLKMNHSGQPAHPLYILATATPLLWQQAFGGSRN